MKKMFKGFIDEFQARVCSSKKRLIKFIAILFVPILYAVTCILAFWNPVDNIGKAPTAILDAEQKVWVYKEYGVKGQESGLVPSVHFGVIVNDNGEPIVDVKKITSGADININSRNSNASIKVCKNLNNTSSNKALDATWCSIEQISLFDLMVESKFISPVDEQLGKTNPEATKWVSKEIEGKQFTNIRYVGATKAEQEYKNKKDYLQIYIPKGFLYTLIQRIGMIVENKDNRIEEPKDISKLGIYTTFERNFIFGYYLNTASKIKDALVLQIIYEMTREFFDSLDNENRDAILDLIQQRYIDFEIKGAVNGIYGIGLGQFFICIGLYVGTLMQTFIYDRAKRTKDTNAFQWFFSKTLLMYLTGIIQVTLLVLTLSLTGFNSLGFSGLFSMWLWLLFCDLIIVLTVQTLWFSFKDETIGKFLIVVYMVLNLAAGWGTFPAFMQSGFFYVVSFITIFTYIMHGLGSVIYGIGTDGFNNLDASYISQQASILLIFLFVFICIAMLVCVKRYKELYFGSSNPKYVKEALEELKLTAMLKDFVEVKNDKNKFIWKNIYKYEYNPDIKSIVKKNHPFEGQFKWYKEKQKDVVLTANESDEEIISRNE